MPEHAGNIGDRRGRRWRTVAWSSAALLLLLPLVAMQFTDQFDWTLSDFVIFAAMLAAVGIAFEVATRKTGNKAYRTAVGVALGTAFILLWVNGAVGIIGSENNPANLMYGGVLVIGIIGAVIARFQPHGMARAMVATAIAQVAVAVIALVAGLGPAGVNLLGDVLLLIVFFVALWLVAAWLFRKSGREITPPL